MDFVQYLGVTDSDNLPASEVLEIVQEVVREWGGQLLLNELGEIKDTMVPYVGPFQDLVKLILELEREGKLVPINSPVLGSILPFRKGSTSDSHATS